MSFAPDPTTLIPFARVKADCFTSSLVAGDAFPMPMLPVLVMVKRSLEFVTSESECAEIVPTSKLLLEIASMNPVVPPLYQVADGRLNLSSIQKLLPDAVSTD